MPLILSHWDGDEVTKALDTRLSKLSFTPLPFEQRPKGVVSETCQDNVRPDVQQRYFKR